MAITLKDQIETVFKQSKKAMHVEEIAQALIDKHLVTDKDKDKLVSSVSSALSLDVKKLKTKSAFKKVKNKQGKFKKGIYQLRPKPINGTEKVIASIAKSQKSELISASSNNTGKGGEYLVFSELLFRDFNVSAMTVDDGIDIVCFKDGKFFYIQVKTSNLQAVVKRKKFQANIRSSQFYKFIHHRPFYVFVLRYCDGVRNLYDFVILPSSDIEKMVEQGVINKSNELTITIEADYDTKKLILNGKEDISYYFNKFDLIK